LLLWLVCRRGLRLLLSFVNAILYQRCPRLLLVDPVHSHGSFTRCQSCRQFFFVQTIPFHPALTSFDPNEPTFTSIGMKPIPPLSPFQACSQNLESSLSSAASILRGDLYSTWYNLCLHQIDLRQHVTKSITVDSIPSAHSRSFPSWTICHLAQCSSLPSPLSILSPGIISSKCWRIKEIYLW